MSGIFTTEVLTGASVVLLVVVLVLLRRMKIGLEQPARELREVLEIQRRRVSEALPVLAAAQGEWVSAPAAARRLAAVEALAETIARDLAAAPRGDAVELQRAVTRNAERAARLARVAAGGRVREQHATLSLIWPQVAERLAERVESNHMLRADIPAGLSPVAGSGECWMEILTELVANALEASRGGGVITVRAGATDRPGWLNVSVEDQGQGISPESLPRVYEPFYTSREGADGLGLALVSSLVEGLGGTMTITSNPGQGTRVSLDVPAAQPGLAPVRFEGRVLVADDDKLMRRAICALLESFGMSPVECDSGTVARELLSAEPERFRAAILDVVMPGSPVDEVVHSVRERSPEFPVLLISGYDTALLVDGLLKAGGVRYLRKPFTREELFGALRDLLSGGAV